MVFESIADEDLRVMLGAVIATSLDEADLFNVRRLGVNAAVQQIYDLLPEYFERRPGWWRVAKSAKGEPLGFVLPVVFQEPRFRKDGQPQGTIFYMGVLPGRRGQRLGLELIHEATRVFIEANCWRIFCDTGTTNAPMIKAFRQAGYTERTPWQRPLA